MARLEGQSIVVTGGTTGIGYAAAERLVAEGARVLITGQDKARVADAAARLGPKATGIVVDQSTLSDIPVLAKAVKDTFGTIDTLFLNAAVAKPNATEAETEAQYDAQFAINLKATFFIVQALVPLVRDGGSIIATTSNVVQLGLPGMAVYAATKGALRSLVRTWAAEYMPRNIRVNAVAPGPIETPIFGKLGIDKASADGMAAMIQSKVPMARFGQPTEIAGAVAFLASADSTFMTGGEITLDGGWTNL